MDPANDAFPFADVCLCGYLRKQKSRRRRYFVLRRRGEGGPPRLEYYQNEKQFREGALRSPPKKSLLLADMMSIRKRADARHEHLIVLCGRQGTFGVAAERGEEQQAWYVAMVELHAKETASSQRDGEGSRLGPGFKEVWQVSLRPRGLGHSRNLSGVYLLCLTEKTVSLVRLNSEEASVVLQLLNVRRCGHSENFFFLEVGRSAATGPGELWMEVEDLRVAQKMHETVLDAMKALSEAFRAPALPSTPILVPARRQAYAPPGQAAFPGRKAPSLGHSPAAPGPMKPPSRKPDSWSDYSAVSSDEGGSSPGELRPPATLDSSRAMAVELDYISMGRQASASPGVSTRKD